MGASNNDLQSFYELQMQQNNEKNNLISNSKIVMFCLKCVEKQTLNLLSLKPYIFFILSSF
jgi:hypothetical protein